MTGDDIDNYFLIFNTLCSTIFFIRQIRNFLIFFKVIKNAILDRPPSFIVEWRRI